MVLLACCLATDAAITIVTKVALLRMQNTLYTDVCSYLSLLMAQLDNNGQFLMNFKVQYDHFGTVKKNSQFWGLSNCNVVIK